MKEITMYKTEDGKLFDDENDAIKHEKDLDFIEWCNNNLYRYSNPSEQAEFILDHWDVERKTST